MIRTSAVTVNENMAGEKYSGERRKKENKPNLYILLINILYNRNYVYNMYGPIMLTVNYICLAIEYRLKLIHELLLCIVSTN